MWRGVVAIAALPTLGASLQPPISAYVGKYPFEKVAGYSFNSNPKVREFVQLATHNKSVLPSVFADGVAGPITREGNVIAAWSCQPHNCGPHNWTIVIVAPDACRRLLFRFRPDDETCLAVWGLEAHPR